MASFNDIGLLRQEWAHPLSSAVFHMTNNGPMQRYRQHFFPWWIMGPFIIIGNISLDQQWAHSMSLAMFLKSNNNAPILCRRCNGHYNRTPDLGRWVMWWDNVGLSKYTILDAKVLDRNVTWLTKHKDTSWYEHKVRRHLAPFVVVNTDKASWQANDKDELGSSSDWRRPR